MIKPQKTTLGQL